VTGLFSILTNSLRQGRPALLDPAQDSPAAHVNASIGQNAGDAFGRGTQLEVPNREQDDVTREAMT
jgi:hypothetical protein